MKPLTIHLSLRAPGPTLLAGLLAWAAPAWSAVIVTGESPGVIIPDANAAGLARTVNVAAPGQIVLDVSLTLTLAGALAGWNGDLYAWLRHESGALSVLLNRPGRTAANSDGYADNGLLDVTFDDAAAGDIHLYQQTWAGSPGPLGGVWQPDARFVDPALVTDASPRAAFLSVFDGGPAGGDWTLFLADLSGGGLVSLEHWRLELITAAAIPIPEPAALAVATVLGLVGLAGARVFRRCQHRAAPGFPSQPAAR